MRLRDYSGTALRDIVRQPVRSLLTVSALILSSFLFVALVSLGLGTRSAITEQLGRDVTANTVIVTSDQPTSGSRFGNNVQLATEGSLKLDGDTVKTLEGLPGVSSVNPRVSVYQFKQFSVAGHRQTYVAKASAVEGSSLQTLGLSTGQPFATGSSSPQVVLGGGYVQALGSGTEAGSLVGKTITIQTVNNYRGLGAELPGADATRAELIDFAKRGTTLQATIVGVTATANDSQMYIPMGWAHGVFSSQVRTATGISSTDVIDRDGYSNIVVQVDSRTAVRSVSAAIAGMGFGVSSSQQLIDQINQLSIVMWIVLGSIAAISMASAALGIVNTMLMTVSEQRYAIGVWRACGATKSLIAGLFLVQATLLGLVGGVLGSGAGRLVSSQVNAKIASLLQSQGLGAMTIQPASTPVLMAAVTLTTLLAVLAALYPASRAARNAYV